MNLMWQQHDALTELINIAFSRAGAALAELTSYRVTLEQPRVTLHPITTVIASLSETLQGEIATVHQVFGGRMAGEALFLMNHTGAVALTGLLADGLPRSQHLDATAGEVLTEVGSIVLSACLGMFGNLLHVHVSFAVPRLHRESLDALLASLVVGREAMRYTLAISTTFRVQQHTLTGYVLIGLGLASLQHLMRAVAELG